MKPSIVTRVLVTALLVFLLTATANAATFTVAWDPNRETDLAGYTVYWGTSSGSYTTTVEVGNQAWFQFTEPDPTRPYFFAVQAYNTGGLRSALSSEVSSTPSVNPSTMPTITSFSPTIGVAGTPVTINGTNFDTLKTNDRTAFNITLGSVTAATTTTISTSVPTLTASGRLSVATNVGTAISAADFFVPPSPYTAADVEYTGRAGYGESKIVGINTSGKIGLLVFDGATNQRASVKIQPGPLSTVKLYNYDGAVITSLSIGAGTSLIEPQTLPQAATYSVSVDPTSTAVGGTTVTVYNVPPDVTGTFMPSAAGDAKTITISTPGQNARWMFNGTAGQRLSMKLGSGPVGSVSILNPDNSVLASKSITAVTTFMEPVNLAATGPYNVFVDPSSANTGSVTITLYNVPADVTGITFVNGPAVRMALATPGQNGSLTFNGTVGQQVTVQMTTNTMSTTGVRLLKPDGTVLTSTTSGAGSFNLTTQTLATAGTYTVVVDPSLYNTGSLNVTVASPNTTATGRYKLDSAGGCYWDPNDSGPNQCTPTGSGRYKLDGTGKCVWDPNDVGPNQCTPTVASLRDRWFDLMARNGWETLGEVREG